MNPQPLTKSHLLDQVNAALSAATPNSLSDAQRVCMTWVRTCVRQLCDNAPANVDYWHRQMAYVVATPNITLGLWAHKVTDVAKHTYRDLEKAAAAHEASTAPVVSRHTTNGTRIHGTFR